MKYFVKFPISNFKFLISNILIFLLFLFLPTQLGKHFWPSFSFINSIKIDYYSPTIYFWDLLLIVCVGYFLIWQKIKVNRKVLTLGLIFLLSQLVSLLVAQNIGAGLVRLAQYILVVGFGILIASIDWRKNRQAAFWGLIVAVLLESGLSIWQFGWGHSIGFWLIGERTFSLSTLSIATFNWYGQIFLRPYGTFPHPNVLGAFIVLSFFLVNYFKRRLPALAVSSGILQLTYGIGAIAGVLSFSRGAILILILQTILYLKNQWKVLLIITFLTIPFLYVRFSSAFNFDSLSITRREELAETSIQQFLKSPVLGTGLNNFITDAASDSFVSGPIRFLQPVHNIFLLELSETGLVGLLGFFLLAGFPIYKLWKKPNDSSKILLSCWGTIIFLGLFDHYFLTLVQGQRLFFLIWGLSMLDYSSEQSDK